MMRAGVSTSWWSTQEAQQCPLVVLVLGVVVAPAAHQSQHRIRQRRIRNRLLLACAFYIFIPIHRLAMLHPDIRYSRNGGEGDARTLLRVAAFAAALLDLDGNIDVS